MDLGRISVRGQNVDVIHQALHPRHGFVWTDGKAIYLAPIKISGGNIEPQQIHKLGEFECSVRSVHWSCDIGPQTCYMCVVLPQHVSLWKVDGAVPKLTFKQVRKLNVQPIPQGCLWNPCRDIMCILSKQQCNFFFRHTHNRGSYAFPPLESGRISCGAWSEDGNRLVLCVGAVILVYSWCEIDVSISDFTPSAWRVPGLDGTIRIVKSISADMLICAAELPLESLCKNTDSFSLPDERGDGSVSNNNNDEVPMIIPRRKKQSVKDTLLNLPRNPESLIQDTSQLITVVLREGRDPQKRTCVGIRALLTPELLVYDPITKAVAVGSNTQCVIQVFTFDGGLKGQLIKTTDLKLDQKERPKGLANLTSSMSRGHQGFLVATTTKVPGDSAFLPSSSGSSFDVQLQFLPFTIPASVSRGNKLNGSVESGETSSLSSVESPRQRVRVQYDSEMDSNDSSPRDLNLSADNDQSTSTSKERPSSCGLSQQSMSNMEVQLSKQSTKTQLCDQSDNDSESSPREITLSLDSQSTCTSSAGIVDLDKKDGDSNSDLETETIEFSEQKPNFANVDMEEYDDTAVQMRKPLHKADLGSSSQDIINVPSPNGSSGQRSRASSQDIDKITDSMGNSNQNFEVSYQRSSTSSREIDVLSDGSRPSSQDIDVTDKRSRSGSQVMEPTADIPTRFNTSNDIEELEKLKLLEDELAKQNAHIAALQEKVNFLSKAVDEASVVFPTKYQSIEKPETILVVCRHSNSSTSRKQFLLDNGRLQLNPIKQAFSLSTVELFLDGEPCVSGCNIDGYIPMRFQPSTTLLISGLPAKSLTEQIKSHNDTDSEHGIEDYDQGTNSEICC